MNSVDIKNLTQTARARGAVGGNAVVPRYIEENRKLFIGKKILDFGCGSAMRHVTKLRDLGLDVYGWDLSLPTPAPEGGGWGLVYLSNVLNVQSTRQSSLNLLQYICMYQAINNCQVLANVASDPWKGEDWSAQNLRDLLFAANWQIVSGKGPKDPSAVWRKCV